ncbi:hypothetical protein CEP52_010957 [Fusarium oligoseptatum]|uniref:Uncharacterized protein n=1 Tax=Fusarium oligoseptatum TaxID=2604345 RepID=A0A428T5R3_9HYPO|nr:hypothetical protein CEP52_010957 [Fusarium oligoseptatum]
MEQQQSAQRPLAGADSIRALKDDNAIFTAFDSYPWTKDKMFMSGLYAILGEPGQQNPQASLADMAIHARAWLASNPDHTPPDVLPEEYRRRDGANASPPPALDWQKAAPKADLYIDRKAAAAQTGSEDQPNYPMGFAEMIKLLKEGKPVPGIRQIPNTIVRDPSVKPVGARAVPRKPWEKDVATDPPTLPDLPKALDTEFPPVDDDVTASANTATA